MFIAKRFTQSLTHSIENIQCEQKSLSDIYRLKFSSHDYNIHSSLEKSLIEREPYSISRIELKVLMTTFLAGLRIAN
jgi:hypothetical protein